MASSGNFPVLNHLKYKASSYTTSNIDSTGLQLGSTTGNAAQMNIGFKLGDGKFYWECYNASIPGSLHFGVCIDNADLNNVTSGKAIIGIREDGRKLLSTGPQTNSTQSSYGGSLAGNVCAVAMDFTNSTMEFFINNSSQGSFSWSSANDGSTYYPYLYMNTGVATINTGQDSSFCGLKTAQGNTDENGFGDFYYTPPSGFLAMCSANLPTDSNIDPAETDDDYPGKLFNTITWTGTGSSNAISGLGFQPDLVWIKRRNGTADNKLTDSSRGVTKSLESNTIDAEATDTNGLTAFGSDGFTVGSDSSYNGSSETYVAWCWRLNGGTTVSNSSGDINSVTQANDKTGLSIVTYTGNGSQGQSIGHGLTKAPEMVWFKNRDYGTRGVSMNWIVSLSTAAGSPFASFSGSSHSIKLSTTDAIQDFFNTQTNFAPTTTTFSVPNNGNAPYWFNGSGDDYVAFCWHSVSGFSKFGTYEGNGNTEGPYVNLGFRPRMLFIRNTEQSSSWSVFDSARQNFNPNENYLTWEGSAAEAGTSNAFDVDFLSNGFKVRSTETNLNTSAKTFLYGAWADVPSKYNNAF